MLLVPAIGQAALPPLLNAEFHTRQQLCEDARRNHPDKKLILLALKNHLCDFEHRACLHVTRTLADPCNHFVRDNFAVYQTRLYRCDEGKPCETQPGTDEIADEWGMSGPDLIVVEPVSCRILGRTGTPIDHFDDPVAAIRIAAMREQLLRIDGVSKIVSPGAKESCSGAEPSLIEIRQELDSQSDTPPIRK
ncbi:MAG: hypothetical protein ACXWPM_00540 [Bdellovibrionota bacterium]